MSASAGPDSARARIAERLMDVSACLLLACLAGRAVMQEMPFHSNPLNVDALVAAAQAEEPQPIFVESGDLVRTTFAMVLLGAMLIWVMGFAIGDRTRRLRGLWFPLLFAGWCAWALWSATKAGDETSALLVWFEQSALLGAGFVAMQVFADRRRFVLLGVVMTAVGGLLAAKAGWYLLVEHPQVVEEFRRNRAEELARLGARPGTAKAAMLTERITEATAKGFGGLANLFAAQLLPLLGAGAGLAGAKVLYARHRRKVDGSKKGEIPLASVLAGVAVLVTVAMAVAMLLTRSRGGVAAAVIAVGGAVAVVKFRATFAERWRAVVLTGVGLLVAVLASLVGMGLLTGRLPGKSLTFRWLYWRGSAELVAEEPLWGVGPGNFADPYLRVRPPEAEEEVKTPHNVIVHAMVQFGLPGGAMYLAALVAVLVFSTRPGRVAQPPPAEVKHGLQEARGTRASAEGSEGCKPYPHGLGTLGCLAGRCVLVVVLAGVVGAVRFWVSQPINGLNVPLLILDALLPALVFVGLLVVLLPWGDPVDDLPGGAMLALRVGLSAGCIGFFLHNMVSYGLWSGGSATAFWIAAGAAAGQGLQGLEVRRFKRIALAGGCLLLLLWFVFSGGGLWVSLLGEAGHQARIARLAGRGELAEAAKLAVLGPNHNFVLSAPLVRDMSAPMNAARLVGAVEQRGQETFKPEWVARFATEIRPGHFGTWRLLGEVCLQAAYKADRSDSDHAESKRRAFRKQAVEAYARAVELNPSDAALRLDYAEALLEAGLKERARQQLDEAGRIDDRLRTFNPQSVVAFGVVQKQRLARLRARAKKD